MNIYATYCRPVYGRRKPLYEVVCSLKLAGEPMVCSMNMTMSIPTDRHIQPGAIINPTREINRFITARNRAYGAHVMAWLMRGT